eukprot:gene4094-biopygen8344
MSVKRRTTLRLGGTRGVSFLPAVARRWTHPTRHPTRHHVAPLTESRCAAAGVGLCQHPPPYPTPRSRALPEFSRSWQEWAGFGGPCQNRSATPRTSPALWTMRANKCYGRTQNVAYRLLRRKTGRGCRGSAAARRGTTAESSPPRSQHPDTPN